MAILSDRMLAAVGMMVIGCCLQQVTADSISIYPSPTESRQTLSLDGVWNFRLSSEKHSGFTGKWFEQSLDQMSGNYERMPVPSSFNDITERREVRDYSGWVWYDRKFFVPSTWTSASGAATLLRFGSVNYLASVYVNGKHAVNHTGGHLPFEAEVGGLLKAGAENHITVAVNNELSAHTLPPGHVYAKNDSRKAGSTFYEINPSFDFFNYAGIHRSVVLSYVPAVRVTDLTVVTTVQSDQSTGVVRYEVKLSKTGTTIDVELIDHEGKMVASKKGATTTSGELTVSNAKLWWPFTMSKTPGYLYTLAVRVSSGGAHHDTIYQKVGIRHVEVKGNQLLVNGKAVYLRGFGKHEDQDIRGRSLDQATILKDFNLIKWIGANSFRTSHYPYSEAIMDEADSQGIIVIDEVPAVGLSEFNTVMLTLHKEQIRELVERDKNRPSVFMFSIANEPASSKHEAKGYFETIAALAKSLDPSKRPITGAISADYHSDQMALSLDVLMINRYFGWYQDTGFPQVIQGKIIADLTHFHEKFKKPVMVSEYGADTIPGMHTEPSFIFSEDFQTEFMVEYHRGFDALRSKGFFIGEHIWNFADFMTKQQISRVGGNKKGIFTRDRQPKTAARLLRCRYWKLSGDLTNSHREGISLCPEAVY